MTKATISAFAPTLHGFKVLTDKGTFYLNKQTLPSGIAPGMEIMFNEHKEGESYPKSFGKEGIFKRAGIHDIMISKTVSSSLLYKAAVTLVEEEA